MTPERTKHCKICNKIFSKPYTCSLKKWKISRYCSRLCSDKSKIGRIPWNKGKPCTWVTNPKGVKRNLTPEWREKLSKAASKSWNERYTKEEQIRLRNKQVETRKKNDNFKGTLGRKKELSVMWLADKATYNTKHRWIQKNWIKNGICSNCHNRPGPYGNRKYGTEWHNIDRKYDREDRNAWIELCSKCHKHFDKI